MTTYSVQTTNCDGAVARRGGLAEKRNPPVLQFPESRMAGYGFASPPYRHTLPSCSCPLALCGHPRLLYRCRSKDVDGRDEPGHDDLLRADDELRWQPVGRMQA